VFSPCVAAVKGRNVLNHCEVIYLVLSGSIIYFDYILKMSTAHALGGVSGVASFLTIDEQLQKTEAAIFSPCEPFFHRTFSFSQINGLILKSPEHGLGINMGTNLNYP